MPKQPSSESENQDNQFLNLESTIRDLPLYKLEIDVSCLGKELVDIFAKNLLLPGVILMQQQQFFGMISRQQILEHLLPYQSLDLFLNQSLQLLSSYTYRSLLILPENTSILTAAQQALRRGTDSKTEPIIVKLDNNNYRLLDFQQLNLAAWQIRGVETQVRYEKIQAQILQSQKMASLGGLVDGLAHEILDPVGFIWGNLTHVSEYTEQLLNLLTIYEQTIPKIPQSLQELQQEIDLEFIRQDLPQALESIKAGAERLKKLSTSLQNFCHIDEVYPKPADLHSSLDGIILLLKSSIKSEIEIVKNYGHLPPISCYIGQLSQVFMNILINAIDALLNQAVSQQLAQQLNPTLVLDSQAKPQITITTKVISRNHSDNYHLEQRYIYISIADNGPGMSPELQAQILESFTITKRRAKETSLAVSYQTITAKHGGEFKMRSQLGIGTEFEIILPL